MPKSAFSLSQEKLRDVFRTFNLPIELGSGGLTKFNRTNQHLPKIIGLMQLVLVKVVITLLFLKISFHLILKRLVEVQDKCVV